MTHNGYAVIDFETTGLWPGQGHRIIEIGLVLVSPDGRIESSHETVVNPNRDVGPTHIHQLRGADVCEAPTFKDVAGELLDRLAGRVVVAHNARFETTFLRAELDRVGLASPLDDDAALCTMKLASRYLPGSGRKLADCCAAFDIPLDNAHEALADATATAHLLAAYLQVGQSDEDAWATWGDIAASLRWPLTSWPGSRWVARPRTQAPSATAVKLGFLERATDHLPALDSNQGETDYAAMLDLALSDGYLSVKEAAELTDLALSLGIDDAGRRRLHIRYFEALTDAVWLDGVLDDLELHEIEAVAAMLDIDEELFLAALQPRQAFFEAPPAAPDDLTPLLAPGSVVVLTGDMWLPRYDIEALLAARGVVVWPGITKKTTLLVAEDTTSLSGKARKARDYGVPVASAEALRRSL